MSATVHPARRVLRHAQGRLAALPLRVRLVAGFVVAITVVLSAAGTFLYWRVAYALDLRLNNDLRNEATTLAPLVTSRGPLRSAADSTGPAGSAQYQVLDASGQVLASGTGLGSAPLLTPRQATAALSGELQVDLGELLPISRRPLRLLAMPLPGTGPARVLVVAVRRDQRDEALRELLAQLFVAGFAALAVSAVVGERLAKAALSPVERYRTQAASIAAGAYGIRLDVPAGRNDEVTRLGHTLNDVLGSLERALDREKRFIQDASHELRTPLTVLSTRVQLSLTRPRTAPEQEAALRELGQDIAALSALADQLLLISTTSSRPVAAATGCDLAAVAEHVTYQQQQMGEDLRPLTFRRTPDGGTMPVAMPGTDLRQVVSNLIGNAVLHGSGAVHVHARTAGRVAVLTVTNEEGGLPQAFLPSAIERFARADDARTRPGAGLGLPLVHGLVDRYDGECRPPPAASVALAWSTTGCPWCSRSATATTCCCTAPPAAACCAAADLCDSAQTP